MLRIRVMSVTEPRLPTRTARIASVSRERKR